MIFPTVAALPLLDPAPPPSLRPGIVLRRSARFERREIALTDRHEDGSGAALTIAGNNITLDFKGMTLRGTPAEAEPDQRAGTALRVQGNEITIKNLTIRGYKVALLAQNCKNLKLENVDASYNWKQRLLSTPEREDEADWMSFHHNENGEWLRYGAGFYLVGCDGFTVRKCRVQGGQCGLMLTQCNRGLVAENDFSFLSGIGVGLYRSSANRVLHNKIDWCVRGYSHGVYQRGQDSAGILVYEQSSRNVFAYNSVTHSGDGFFLWAGQTTMDTGRGGCDDNLVYGNDFSHAPANGIEATFSRNVFANNLILECWHGLWGGFSYNSQIIGNRFGVNAEAIAIESGYQNRITDNVFIGDLTGIALWTSPHLSGLSNYTRQRDPASRDYHLERNEFQQVPVMMRLRDTRAIAESKNVQIQREPSLLPVLTDVGQSIPGNEPRPSSLARIFAAQWNPQAARVAGIFAPPRLKGARSAFLPPNALRGRRYIRIDAWGPYDFKSPLILRRPDRNAETNIVKLDILGPQGSWRLVSAEGLDRFTATLGVVPGDVTATRTPNARRCRVVLEYVGEETVDYRGSATPAGAPVRFLFESEP